MVRIHSCKVASNYVFKVLKEFCKVITRMSINASNYVFKTLKEFCKVMRMSINASSSRHIARYKKYETQGNYRHFYVVWRITDDDERIFWQRLSS